ncbi:hypothetical protein PDESU_00867 [Pontiella desulfatans]|uniref:Uncharacterized protein n=1 Tax=Pontiella desulfatans TaxID=2750659 RepID=A0A6C2TYP7_PONDE|nr:hypothetical protein [Pontiella desulfatans]VGO12316.1 hypothetical protein PDESU_00867 [Pontiella desulfatans]
MNDPIVEEVRKYRDEHARKFNYDLDAIVEDLISRQKENKRQVVDLSKGRSSQRKLPAA